MTALHVEPASMDETAKRNTVAEMIRISNKTAGNEFIVYCSGSSLVEMELNRLSEKDFLIFIPIIVILIFIFIIILFYGHRRDVCLYSISFHPAGHDAGNSPGA